MITKFKIQITGIIAALGISLSGLSQTTITQSFQVSGNCGMCEKTIEKAAIKQGASKADWNKDTKVLSVQFNTKKVRADDILKGVAYAGYDNEKYLAPDEAYTNLHECCKYERAKEKKEQHTSVTSSGKETETKAKTETRQKANELDQVYEIYFSIKDALVKDNSKQAALKGKDLLNALADVKMEKLGDKEHLVFMKQLSGLKTDAGKIAESKDLAKQREQFTGLSEKMYELMKAIRPAYPVYLDHCPMFNDGKGADWISKESAIKNPYYGSEMLSCGKVKETLK
jgi:hypothetical protein